MLNRLSLLYFVTINTTWFVSWKVTFYFKGDVEHMNGKEQQLLESDSILKLYTEIQDREQKDRVNTSDNKDAEPPPGRFWLNFCLKVA